MEALQILFGAYYAFLDAIVSPSTLGRGGRNRRRENLGIAKKCGGGLTYAKIFLVDL